MFHQSLGIEFSGHSLRLVHLAKSMGGYKLLGYQQAALPDGDISDAGYQNAVVAQLKEFVAQHKLKHSGVVIGLPPCEVALRQIELPAVEREDLCRLLEYEIECHLPFTSHEVYLDFQITGKKENVQKLILLAAKKERVDQYLALLAQADMSCLAVDFTPLAIINLLQVNGIINNGNNGLSPQSCLLIEVGREAVEFSLIKQGKLVMVRSRPIAELGSLIPARSDSAGYPDENIAAGSEVKIEELADRITREIDCWQKSSPAGLERPWVEQIFVMTDHGAGAHICQKLNEELEIKASIPQDWSIIKPGTDKADIDIELAAGMGLALRGISDYPEAINLLPALQRRQQKKGGQFAIMGLAAMVAVLLIANLVGLFLKDRLALSRMQQQMQQLKPRLKVVGELEAEYKRLRLQMEALRSIKPREISILDILKELTMKFPSDVWLDKMAIEGNTVEIGGRAASASSLIPLLEESPLFENVKFAATITSRAGEKEKFKIKMTVEDRAAGKVLRQQGS